MTPERLSDFCMTGGAILPIFLGLAEQPALAVMAMVLLLVAGCLLASCDPGAPFRTVKRHDSAPPPSEGND